MRDFFRPGRSELVSRAAAIATSHPLSTAAGLEILAAGGNAADAAIAAVAVQCVVDPLMTGIGGDCFALYAPANGAVVALNGSGRAPAGATVARLAGLGLDREIPRTSPHAVTVPGAIAAWVKLHQRFATLPLDRLFARAIGYAEVGFALTPRVAWDWARNARILANDEAATALFLPKGQAPLAGDVFAQPKLGQRLREIAQHGASAFYLGPTANSLVKRLNALGGLHTADDFANAVDGAEFVAPIGVDYRGHRVLECPPNGQGVAALLILKILEGFDLSEEVSLADRIHLHAEATKLAYHHRDVLIGDPSATTPDTVETLLSEPTVAALRRRIDPTRAMPPALWDEPEHKDTVYLCVVDRDGNAVSFINSIFHPFGSTRVDPETGILLHSRGASFRLIEGHPNAIGPRKRPMHTIIPGMLQKHGRTVMPFGVMGGHYQAAGHAALISGILDRNLDIQTAIDTPRSFAFDGLLEYEPTLNPETLADLARRGHALAKAAAPIGGAQAIRIDLQAGILHAGSDSRKDGCALGF